MSVVKLDFKRRLARLETSASQIDAAERQAASHREALRLRVKICDLIRKRFLLMGLDPTLAVGLKLGQDAAAELDAIPDSEALRTADEAITRNDLIRRDHSVSSVKEKIYRIAVKFNDGSQPDFAKASVIELLAVCIGSKNLPSAEQNRSLNNRAICLTVEPPLRARGRVPRVPKPDHREVAAVIKNGPKHGRV